MSRHSRPWAKLTNRSPPPPVRPTPPLPRAPTPRSDRRQKHSFTPPRVCLAVGLTPGASTQTSCAQTSSGTGRPRCRVQRRSRIRPRMSLRKGGCRSSSSFGAVGRGTPHDLDMFHMWCIPLSFDLPHPAAHKSPMSQMESQVALRRGANTGDCGETQIGFQVAQQFLAHCEAQTRWHDHLMGHLGCHQECIGCSLARIWTIILTQLMSVCSIEISPFARSIDVSFVRSFVHTPPAHVGARESSSARDWDRNPSFDMGCGWRGGSRDGRGGCGLLGAGWVRLGSGSPGWGCGLGGGSGWGGVVWGGAGWGR